MEFCLCPWLQVRVSSSLITDVMIMTSGDGSSHQASAAPLSRRLCTAGRREASYLAEGVPTRGGGAAQSLVTTVQLEDGGDGPGLYRLGAGGVLRHSERRGRAAGR